MIEKREQGSSLFFGFYLRCFRISVKAATTAMMTTRCHISPTSFPVGLCRSQPVAVSLRVGSFLPYLPQQNNTKEALVMVRCLASLQKNQG